MSRTSFNLSLISFILFFGAGSIGFAQQRANDFTKRVRSLDGKLNAMSSKRLSTSRINSVSSQRFSVHEWPSRFSPFGGKRFPMQNKNTLGSERIKTSVMEVELPHNQNYATENSKRAFSSNSENKSMAAASVEFRDAYYAQLDKRVDDWMSKVNNMSMQDINRFQFRKGRSNEPGFPVQKAGSESLPMTSSEQKLGNSNVRGVIPSGQGNAGAGRPSYWLGPKKMVSSTTSGRVSGSASAQSNSAQTSKRFPSPLRPVLGPKKIRVQKK
jgi:hypothetical protein